MDSSFIKKFVDSINASAPTSKQLLESGFSLSEIDILIKRSPITIKKTKEAGNSYNQEMNAYLQWLYNTYDVSKLEIGMVKFHSFLRKHKYGVEFAEDEADHIVLNKNTGIIEVYELGNHDYVISKCAASLEQFFEALIIANRFFTHCLLDEKYDEDREVTYEQAKFASETAGGDEYEDFYHYLFGSEQIK